MAFVPGRQDLTSDAIEHFLWPLLKRTAYFFFFVAAKQPFNRGSKFLCRGFQGSSSFISYHKRLLSREQHSFPKLSQSHCTFQILETWLWPLGYPIITRSAWNTCKALWPLLNVRLTIAKVIFGQILEYSLHCITLAKEKKRRRTVTLGLRYVFVLFSLSTLYFTTFDWSLTMQMKQWEKNVVFGWAGVCGEGWKTSALKTPAWVVYYVAR